MASHHLQQKKTFTEGMEKVRFHLDLFCVVIVIYHVISLHEKHSWNSWNWNLLSLSSLCQLCFSKKKVSKVWLKRALLKRQISVSLKNFISQSILNSWSEMSPGGLFYVRDTKNFFINFIFHAQLHEKL